MGYFKDEKETTLTVDSKGFIHSGDVGMILKNGSIAITGRIK
jgi:long-subunit acyl-CoA synthetase (AMP-forming)